MSTRRDGGGNLGKMTVHRLDVAGGQDQTRRLAVLRTDRTKDIGGGCALILQRHRPRAALGPAPGDLRLLPDAGFISKPDLYVTRIDTLVARDLLQDPRETFLKSAIAPSAWA